MTKDLKYVNCFLFLSIVAFFFLPLTLPFLMDKSIFSVISIIVLPIMLFINLHKVPSTNFNKILILFICLILFTMYYRGTGFGSLGSNVQGGFLYVQMLSVLLLIIVAQAIEIRTPKLKRFLIFVFFLSVFFLVLQLLISIGSLSPSNYLIKAIEIQTGYSLLNSIGYFRIMGLKTISLYLILIILLLRKSNNITFFILIMFFIILAIATLSGFRINMIELLSIITFTYLVSDQSNKVKIRGLISFIILFGVLYLVLFLLQQFLPDVIVRTFSWLPGIQSENAQFTSEWRIEVWRLAILYELPQYLLVGKGLTYGQSNKLNIVGEEKYLSVLDNLNYHSGPISLVICFGLFGLILFLLFHYYIIKLIFWIRKNPLHSNNKDFRILFNSINALYFMKLFIFIVFYGDISFSFAELNVIVSLILLCSGIVVKNNYCNK